MITTYFLAAFYGLFGLLLNLLPTGSLPSGFSEALAYFWGTMNAFSYLIPVDTMLQALLLVLAFDLVVLLWHFIHWSMAKIPFLHIR